MLGFTHESDGRNPRIGCGEQRPTPEPNSEVNDVGKHWRIEQVRRPELPPGPALPLAKQPPAPAIKPIDDTFDVVNGRTNWFYLRPSCKTENIAHEGFPVRACRYCFRSSG